MTNKKLLDTKLVTKRAVISERVSHQGSGDVCVEHALYSLGSSWVL